MLKSLKRFFEEAFTEADPARAERDREHALRVATAALLVEMSRADHEYEAAEQATILRVLGQKFALDAPAARALLDEASDEADSAVSLHQFTSLLHEHLSVRDKHRLIEVLWQVAFADGELDKYEDYLVRKVADLLYVSHADLVRLKHRAK